MASTRHAIEEIVTTRNTAVIGCVCGWTHEERKDYDGNAARARCRSAFASHKEGE